MEDEIIRDQRQRQRQGLVSACLSNRASSFALYAVLHAAYHVKVVCIYLLIDRQPQTFTGAASNSRTTNISH